MDHKEIASAIMKGELDNELSYITEAIRLRKEINSHLLRIELKEGDRVRFISTIRPKYLAGVEGTFVRGNASRVVVDLDFRVRRFFKGINVPPSLLERVT